MEFLAPETGLMFWMFIVFFSFLVTVFAVIDVVMSRFRDSDKLICLLVAIFAPFGGFIYFFVGFGQKVEKEA
jgi:uncharacterized membrane protein YhaH (DUF805 family)